LNYVGILVEGAFLASTLHDERGTGNNKGGGGPKIRERERGREGERRNYKVLGRFSGVFGYLYKKCITLYIIY